MPQSQTKGQKATDADSTSNRVSNNLPPRDPKFTGRSRELLEIQARLNERKISAISQPSTHHGLGKTSLAITYGWEQLGNYPGGVFFVNAATGVLVSEIAKLAELLDITQEKSEGKMAFRVGQRLAASEPALVIFDGLDHPMKWTQIQQLRIAPNGNCHCLMTTSLPSLDGVEFFEIEGLPTDDAVQMLSAFRLDATESDNLAVVRNVVEQVGGSPMELTLIGGYAGLNLAVPWSNVCDRLEQTLSSATADDLSVIQLLYEDVLTSLTAQQRIGMHCATLLPDDFIPMSWLRRLVESDIAVNLAKESGEPIQTGQEVVGILLSLQILRPQSPSYKILTIPRALRSHLFRSSVRNETKQALLSQLLGFIEPRMAGADLAIEQPVFRAEMTPLVEFSKKLVGLERIGEGAKFANKLAVVLHQLGRFHEASALLDVYVVEEVLSRLDPIGAAVLLSDKAAVVESIGDAEIARRLMQRANEIKQRYLQPESQKTTTSVAANDEDSIVNWLAESDELERENRKVDPSARFFKLDEADRVASIELIKSETNETVTEANENTVVNDIGSKKKQGPIKLPRRHEEADNSGAAAKSLLNEMYSDVDRMVKKSGEQSATKPSAGDSSSKSKGDKPTSERWKTEDESERQATEDGAGTTPDASEQEAFGSAMLDAMQDEPESQTEAIEELRELPIDGMEVQIRLLMRGSTLTAPVQTEIRDRLGELHRRVRRLRVFRVEVDSNDADLQSVVIKTWGTNVLDHGDADSIEPDILVAASNSSVMTAVDEAIRQIDDHVATQKPSDAKDKRQRRSSLVVVSGALALTVALIAIFVISQVMRPREIEPISVEDYFRIRLEDSGIDPDAASVHIPLDVANEWYSEATGDFVTNSRMLKDIKQLNETGEATALKQNPSRSRGLGLLWSGKENGEIDYSLREMQRKRNGFPRT